jgi:hypothetical protein
MKSSAETAGDNAFEAADSEEDQCGKLADVARSAPASTGIPFDKRPSSGGDPPPPRIAPPRLSGKCRGEAFNPNPRKALLYRPTFAQLSYALAAAVLEMETRHGEPRAPAPAADALFIYLSGDGVEQPAEPPTSRESDIPSSSSPIAAGDPGEASPPERDRNAIYLADLLPFTRRPSFLVIDSEASAAFNPQRSPFGQPLVCLLAPQRTPPEFADVARQGSLFTLFLTQPLLAFWLIHRKGSPSSAFIDRATARLAAAFGGDLLPMLASAPLDASLDAFLTNDFTRGYLLRFVLCHAALTAHPAFPDPQLRPTSFPVLPLSILSDPALGSLVADLHRWLDPPH